MSFDFHFDSFERTFVAGGWILELLIAYWGFIFRIQDLGVLYVCYPHSVIERQGFSNWLCCIDSEEKIELKCQVLGFEVLTLVE